MRVEGEVACDQRIERLALSTGRPLNLLTLGVCFLFVSFIASVLVSVAAIAIISSALLFSRPAFLKFRH